MRLRLRLPPSNESIAGIPQRWFAWRPVLVGDTLVWREYVYRTRWHDPMGYPWPFAWYWKYELWEDHAAKNLQRAREDLFAETRANFERANAESLSRD